MGDNQGNTVRLVEYFMKGAEGVGHKTESENRGFRFGNPCVNITFLTAGRL